MLASSSWVGTCELWQLMSRTLSEHGQEAAFRETRQRSQRVVLGMKTNAERALAETGGKLYCSYIAAATVVVVCWPLEILNRSMVRIRDGSESGKL